MELFLVVLLLLAVIGLSNIVNHLVPSIPVPIIQIALGVIIASGPVGIHIPMEPDLFFVLFIAPLLFNDGKNVSRESLWKLRKPIAFLALGLVLVTVLAIGYLTHALIPSIPLSAAFALAAILSPTDVVSVSALASRVRMPKGVMHLLEGEGLMNDASSLVALNFAVVATVTGVFSLAEAGLSFLVVALGGLAGGAILAYLIIRFKIFLRRHGMEDVTIHMLIQILTPFFIFLVIEHYHFSGILAVVAAGIVHAVQRDHEKSPHVQLQIVSKNTWSVIVYILNGLVFILLGLQIPGVVNEIFKSSNYNNVEVIGYALIISVALLCVRFLCIYLFWRLEWMRREQDGPKHTWREVEIMTISGVRGAVTLAGAFSIPFVLADGSPFPERSLILFIAAWVILITLSLASIILPMIVKPEKGKVEIKNRRREVERVALIRTQVAAIRVLRQEITDENREVVMKVISNYNATINRLKHKESGVDTLGEKKVESEIRIRGLEAESHYIKRLVEEKQIDIDTASQCQEYIRRMEIAVTDRLIYRLLIISTLLKRSLFRLLQFFAPNKEEIRQKRSVQNQKIIRLRIKMAEKGIDEVKKGLLPENRTISYLIIGDYTELITKFKLAKSGKSPKEFALLERGLQDKAFQAERDEVQTMYEKGKITADMTRKIRRQINMREAYVMEEG